MQAGRRVEEFPSRSEMLALLLSTVPGGVVTLRPTLPRVEEFPSRSEMLALLLSTVPGGVVTLRPTLPWGSTRNAAGPAARRNDPAYRS
ncbi:Uncharacterized protein DBV15_07475 [Temnothorax longispinosus]|uniref:Uncharacterized protein n=1 Tax=Temnothorax longispinosus TaxID=300112 RepID=A0A4S2KFQ0_9HYME|nr:Uncharacterized protein DBV15_07475 [Temnothorax longispinosus]